MKTRVYGITLTFLFLGILVLTFSIQPVRAWSAPVYIRADGSIDPPDAPLITYDNMTYTLTDNITSSSNGIVVERNNIIVDGSNYTLQGTGISLKYGIKLPEKNNITIKDIQIKQFYYGIALHSSFNNIVQGNKITESERCGVYLLSSYNNLVSGNKITTNNSKFGRGVIVWNSYYNEVSGSKIANNTRGVDIAESSGNLFQENEITNNRRGFDIVSSSGNFFQENRITNNGIGFDLLSSFDNTISGNTITSHESYGIKLVHSSDNTVSGNNITANKNGVYHLGQKPLCSNNSFSHNNFINNINQAHSSSARWSSVNIWDNGYPSGGNYWSDYASVDENNGPYQNITGRDGIGDTLYTIDEDNQDNYPLMNPWTHLDLTPPIIHIVSPQNRMYRTTSIPLNFTLYDPVHTSPTSWIGCSLDGGANVTVTGNTTLTGLHYGHHNFTLYANDSGGNMGCSETIYLTVTFVADLNCDGKVNMKDIAIAASAFGSHPNHPRWNPIADLNKDNQVNMRDIALIASDFGEEWP